MSKEYKININPRILELLGPNLYTNIYYIIAELIANAYDADAENVYIIDKEDRIIVEDDGTGMSYKNGDIANYLEVAKETRTSSNESETRGKKRLKMGRKGIGKLAALSVSENVEIKTIRNGEKSGFILSRKIEDDNKLTPIDDDEIEFEIIKKDGTSIVMLDPHYKLNKGLNVIKKNILKMFPIANKDFRIHIIRRDKFEVIDSFENSIIDKLACLITFGSDYKYLSKLFKVEKENERPELLDTRGDIIIKNVPLLDKEKKQVNKDIIICGWIGAYKTTRGNKVSASDFQENFISLYANGKVGEFNILPLVGQNKLLEVYIVGQFHVDIFEDSDLNDMSLSNRQGYKDDDPRYIHVTQMIKDEILPKCVELRSKWATFRSAEKDLQKWKENERNEKKLRKDVDEFSRKTINTLQKEVIKRVEKNDRIEGDEFQKIVTKTINDNMNFLKLKAHVSGQKKKLIISHTKADKDLCNIVYKMLIYNRVPKEEIIYTNCDDQEARIPEGKDIYDYLRTFFVESITDDKIYALFVTSKAMSQSWGALSEVGATWIIKLEHKIFNLQVFDEHGNLDGFCPSRPLDVGKEWQQSIRDEKKSICMNEIELDKFCVKLMDVCLNIGYEPKDKELIKTRLKDYVVIID